jgi:formylglycine-generating enzyme required for sulfatase activity
MAGNVWEWVEDWWHPTYYQTPQPINPQGPDSGEYKVLRGGSWSGLNTIVRSTYRYAFVPTITDGFFGFRCAMDADQ